MTQRQKSKRAATSKRPKARRAAPTPAAPKPPAAAGDGRAPEPPAEPGSRQLAELTALHAVAMAGAQASSVDELIERATQVIGETLFPDNFGLLIVDEASGALHHHRSYRGTSAQARQTVIPLGQGITGSVAASGHPWRVADVTRERRYLDLNPETRSELCVPLKAGERVIGVINAESTRVAAYDAADERLLMTFAGQLATAMEKLRLFEGERRQRELAEALREVGTALAGTLDVDTLLDRILDQIARIIPFDAANVMWVEQGHVRVVRQRGYDQFGAHVVEAQRQLQLEIASTPNLRRMVETRQPLVVPDTRADPGWIKVEAGAYLRSWAGAPILSQGEVVAFFSLDKIEPGFYQPSDAERLAVITVQASLALQNARLYRSAEKRAAELEAVRQAGLALNASLQLPEVLDSILRSVLALAKGAQDAHIFLYVGERLEFGAAMTCDGRRSAPYSEPRPAGLSYSVARSGEPMVVTDMRTHPLFADAPHDWRGAILGLPLRIGTRVVGVMNVSYSDPRPAGFGEAELRVLRLLGDQAAGVIENARLFEATRRQLQELTVLQAVAAAVAEADNSDALIDRVTLIIGESLFPDNFGVMLVDRAAGVLRAHPSYRIEPKDAEIMHTPVALNTGITGRVAATGRAWRIPDVSAERDYFASDPKTRSELCVPLWVSGLVAGVVNAESSRPHAFSQDDERLLTTLSGQLATGLEKLALFEAEHRARYQAETLREVALALNTILDRDQLLRAILEQLARVVNFHSASVMLLSEQGLAIVAHRGFRAEGQHFSPSELQTLQHVREVLEKRQPVLISDTRADPRWHQVPGTDYLRCWLGVPLVVKDRAIGLLNLDHNLPAFYTPQHTDLATAFASQAAVALERLRLLDETQRRESEMATLLSVSRAVSSSVSLDDVLQQVATSLAGALGMDRCALSTYDADRQEVATLAVYSVHGQPDPQQANTYYRLADYPATARVMQSDEVVVVRGADPDADPAEVALLGAGGMSVLLMLAMRVGGRTVGLVELLSSDEVREFTADELRLARALADQAGVAIENARLFEAERRQLRLAQTLQAVGARLTAQMSLNEVFEDIFDLLARVVVYDSASIQLMSDDGTMYLAAGRGFKDMDEARERVRYVSQHRPAQVWLDHRLMVMPDTRDDARWVVAPGDQYIRSWAGAALVVKGRLVGILTADSATPHTYDQTTGDTVMAFANQAAIAIENARLFEAERRRVAVLTALHETGLDLSARLELTDLLATMVERAARLLEAPSGGLYLARPDEQVLELMVSFNLPEAYTGTHLRFGEGLAGTVAQTGQPLIVGDYARWPGRAGAFHQAAWGAVVGVPIPWHAKVLGVISLIDERAHRFGAADVELLSLFADQAASAIVNARLFAEAERKTQELAGLYNVAVATSHVLDLEALLQGLHEQVQQILHPDTFAVVLYHAQSDDLEIALAVENGVALPRQSLPRREGGLTGWIVLNRQPLLIGDLGTDPLPVEGRHLTTPARAWLGVPLIAHDRVLGVVSVQSFRPHAFQEGDRRFLESAAGQVAVALENARLYTDLSTKASELGRMYAAAQDMGASLEPQVVLEELARHLTDALHATSAFVLDLNLKDATLTVLAEHWGPAAHPAERISDLGRIYSLRDYPATSQALSQGELLEVQAASLTAPEAERLQLVEYGVKSALMVPIAARGHVLGLAKIWESREAREFTAADRHLAQTLVRQAAGVLENAQLFKALADEKQRLELLYNLSRNLTNSVDPHQVATTALDLICAAFGAQTGTVFITQGRSDRLQLLAVASADPSQLEALDQKIDLRLGKGLAGWAAEKRTVSIAVDVSRDPRWISVPGVDDWVRSAISVPLIVGDELAGVLNLSSDRLSAFRAEHVPLLTAATTPVAAALQNARLFEAEARRVRDLDLLNRITRTAIETADFRAMLQRLADRLGEWTGADSCHLTLWDEARRTAVPIAAFGPMRDSYREVAPEPGEPTLTGAVLEAGSALVVDDAFNTPHLSPRLAAQFQARSILALPLIAGDQRLGAALIGYNEPHHFTPEEVARGVQAAGQIALAVAKARLFEDARRHAEEMMAASDILRALNATPNVEEAFPAMVSGLKSISGCERVSLALLDDSWTTVTIAALDKPRTELGQGTRFPVSATAAAIDVLAGRSHLTPDLAAELDFPAERALHEAGFRSRINLPLRVGETVMGALNLVWRHANGYGDTNLRLLEQIADACALAVEKQRLFTVTERRADELETLVGVSSALRAARTGEEMIPIFLQKTAEIVRHGAYTILLIEPDTGDLVIRGCHPPDPEALGQRHSGREGLTGHVASTGEVHIAEDVSSDRLSHLLRAETGRLRAARSSIALPLRTHELTVGVLYVGLYEPHAFSDTEISLLTAIAEMAGNALQRANVMETLEQRVAERTQELAQANERLKELDRLKDQFVSSVSHELRTPLTNIKLHLGLLDKRGPGVLDRYMPILLRETERLRRLIEDLLDLSRLQAQALPPQREPHRLDALLSEILAVHSTRAEGHDLTLRHEVNPEVPAVPVDRAQAVQVFTNLVGNAVAYTPSGGRVTITSAVVKDGPKDGVAVYVHNDGPVIPAEDLPHLFERFYRGQTGRESGEPGTGLGLAIVKDIVERHGGFVEVESSVPAGTTFTVWLPLAPDVGDLLLR